MTDTATTEAAPASRLDRLIRWAALRLQERSTINSLCTFVTGTLGFSIGLSAETVFSIAGVVFVVLHALIPEKVPLAALPASADASSGSTQTPEAASDTPT